eukprot:UC1_evm1s2084
MDDDFLSETALNGIGAAINAAGSLSFLACCLVAALITLYGESHRGSGASAGADAGSIVLWLCFTNMGYALFFTLPRATSFSLVPVDYGGVRDDCIGLCNEAVCPSQSIMHFFSFASLAWECLILFRASRILGRVNWYRENKQDCGNRGNSGDSGGSVVAVGGGGGGIGGDREGDGRNIDRDDNSGSGSRGSTRNINYNNKNKGLVPDMRVTLVHHFMCWSAALVVGIGFGLYCEYGHSQDHVHAAMAANLVLAVLWFLVVCAVWVWAAVLQCSHVRRNSRAIRLAYAQQQQYDHYWTHADLVNRITLARIRRQRLRELARPLYVYPLAFFAVSAPLGVYGVWDTLHLLRNEDETVQSIEFVVRAAAFILLALRGFVT